MFYDFFLGLLGILLTLSAAFEFQHKNVKNDASGTLDEKATVTFSEMLEHAFYQCLNLVQGIYFHTIRYDTILLSRLCSLFLVSSPWLVRRLFPVNSFSDNYSSVVNDGRSWSSGMISSMYRIKKCQYLLYKHFLLHGLNISVAFGSIRITTTRDFRWYWLLLNMSYVMEFFLQTLVKKKKMGQFFMLMLQWLLMIAASLKACYMLRYINIFTAIGSLYMNFLNRNLDLFNVMTIATLFKIFDV